MTYEELRDSVDSLEDAMIVWASWENTEEEPEERRSGHTLSELTVILGSQELAQGVWARWGYRPPSDPEELRRHAHRWHSYEYTMRGLNTDLSTGRITPEEYDLLEQEAYEKASKKN